MFLWQNKNLGQNIPLHYCWRGILTWPAWIWQQRESVLEQDQEVQSLTRQMDPLRTESEIKLDGESVTSNRIRYHNQWNWISQPMKLNVTINERESESVCEQDPELQSQTRQMCKLMTESETQRWKWKCHNHQRGQMDPLHWWLKMKVKMHVKVSRSKIKKYAAFTGEWKWKWMWKSKGKCICANSSHHTVGQV